MGTVCKSIDGGKQLINQSMNRWINWWTYGLEADDECRLISWCGIESSIRNYQMDRLIVRQKDSSTVRIKLIETDWTISNALNGKVSRWIQPVQVTISHTTFQRSSLANVKTTLELSIIVIVRHNCKFDLILLHLMN